MNAPEIRQRLFQARTNLVSQLRGMGEDWKFNGKDSITNVVTGDTLRFSGEHGGVEFISNEKRVTG